MDVQQQQNHDLQRVAELVEEIKFAMMTTEDDDGALRSRPMTTLQMDATGNLWFFTGADSPKVEEAEHHHHQVNLSYARIDRQDYVSISGTAQILRDKAKMQELWTPWIKPWFPQGLDDPNLCLMKVTITAAEYWDSPGNAAKRLYGLAKGIATGNTDGLGENRKIRV